MPGVPPRTPGRPPAPLPLTGERTLPGIPAENYWFRRHEAAYAWAAEAIGAGRDRVRDPILDAGAGEGYGTHVLPGALGVELDAATVRHARARYPAVPWVRANLVALPLADRSCAAAVSLQVIEHIWDPLAYLRELARCARGPIVVSTPNRPVHSPGLARRAKPDNPFHVREFDADELAELLGDADAARSVRMFGLHHGPRVAGWEAEHGSLPDALLADDPSAVDFAEQVGIADFAIRPLAECDGSSVHDLVALW